MVNQQLKDYIDEQVRVGVSKDAIKNALLEAGWNLSEVNEAMGVGGAQPIAPRMDAVKPAAQSATVAATSPTVSSRPQVQQVRPTQQSAARPASMQQQPAMRESQPQRVMPVTDVKPMAVAKVSSLSAGIAPATLVSTSTSGRPVRKGHRLIDLVMGFLIFILGLAAAGFFVKNSNLSSALGLAQSDKETVVSQSAALREQNQTLQADKEALQTERDDLASQLGILVSTRTSGDESVSVKGLLGVSGDKALYTLRTTAGLVVTLKNSRDLAIEPTLKQFLGSAISISGMHQVGSKDIIVMTINGAVVVAVPTMNTTSTTSSTTQ